MTTLQEQVRIRMLRWLSANDPGGEYSDAEADANGWPRLTLAQAHELVRDVSEAAMARDRERLARVLWRLELRAERQAACRWCGGWDAALAQCPAHESPCQSVVRATKGGDR